MIPDRSVSKIYDSLLLLPNNEWLDVRQLVKDGFSEIVIHGGGLELIVRLSKRSHVTVWHRETAICIQVHVYCVTAGISDQ